MDSLYQNVYTTTFRQAQASTFNNFINDYYDDEGWWAMAWIRVYDVTKDTQYLAQAETIFADMQTGLMGSCGGQWWDKEHTQAILTFPFLKKYLADVETRLVRSRTNSSSLLLLVWQIVTLQIPQSTCNSL